MPDARFIQSASSVAPTLRSSSIIAGVASLTSLPDARLRSMNPNVEGKPPGGGWAGVSTGAPLYSQHSVQTKETGRADIEFLDATQYTINGTGPFAYTPGQTIAYNGWSVVLDGAPAAGDTFSVGPTGANSSDNGNAKLLSNLDDARVLNGGTLTLNGAIGGLTTQVGSAARQADYSAQAQQVIHDQAQAARDAVSGVNLDEEAADLMRLQQAYQAASQIIATADTLFQSLLAATRR